METLALSRSHHASDSKNNLQRPNILIKRRKKKISKKYIHDADPIEICPITGGIILRFYL